MAQLDSSTIYGNLTVNNNLNAKGLTTLTDLTVNNLISGSISGNAATATKLETPRTISLAGDVTGSVSFDGSGNTSIATTYKNSGVTAGTYTSVTVDAKGNVTAGTNPGFITSYTNTVTTLTAGNAITISDSGTSGNHIYTINHADTSTVANLTAASRTYVTGLTFDTYGHVTGFATATETVVDTNTATAVDNILDGSNSGTAITYAPYTTQQAKLSLDTSTTFPTRTDRLNLNGNFYATQLFSGGGTFSGPLVLDVSVAGDGGWDDCGLILKNNNATSGECAVSFTNITTGDNYWIMGLNQNDSLKIAYGTSFTDGFVKLELTPAGSLLVNGTAVSLSNHSHAYSSLTSRPIPLREFYVIPSGGLVKYTNTTIPNSKTYVVGSKTLKVFRDGLLQRIDSNSTAKDNDYWEVSTTQVRFNYSIPEGSVIDYEVIPLT